MDGWAAPRLLPEGWVPRSIAFDAGGRTMLGYLREDPDAPAMQRVAIADQWGAHEWVDGFVLGPTVDDRPADVAVAVGADGAAAACVISLTGAEPAVKVRHRFLYRPAGSDRWEDPVEVFGAPMATWLTPTVQVAPNGLAVVMVGRSQRVLGGTSTTVVLSAHARNGAWTAPQPVNPVRSRTAAAQLALDAAGNATVAWVHRWWSDEDGDPALDRHSVRVLTREAGSGALTPPVVITPEEGSATVSGVRLAVNAGGAAVLATGYTPDPVDQGLQLHATTRASHGSPWMPLTLLFSILRTLASHPAAVGVSASGTSVVLHSSRPRFGSRVPIVGMSRCLPGGAWGQPQKMSAPDVTLSSGAIAMRGEDAVAVYEAAVGQALPVTPGIAVLQAGLWHGASAAPEAPTDLAPQGTTHHLVQLLPDNTGSVVAAEVATVGVGRRGSLVNLDSVLPEVRRISGTQPVTGLAFSRDGTRVAVAAATVARVVDLATGGVVRAVDHGATVYRVGYASDGSSVATCGADSTARLTRVDTGEELVRLVHTAAVVDLALGLGGQRLASAGRDGKVMVARLGAGTGTLQHDDEVNAVAFSADGARLATGCADGAARIFDGSGNGAELIRLQQGAAVTRVELDRDGSRLATVGSDRSARLYDGANGSPIADLTQGGQVLALAFDGDMSRVGTANADHSCRIFTAATGAVALTVRHRDQVTGLAFSADGRWLATVTAEDIVYVRDRTGTEVARLRHGTPVTAVCFTPDGRLLATGCADGKVRVYALDGAR